MKRSNASLAAAAHWAKRQHRAAEKGSDEKIETKPIESIEKSTDSSEQKKTEIKTKASTNTKDSTDAISTHGSTATNGTTASKTSPIRLLFNNSYELVDKNKPQYNTHTVSITELVGSPDLTDSFQFNFSVDVEFFLSYIHPRARCNLTFITGSDLELVPSKQKIGHIKADVPNRYGSHHTKMMVNFYNDDTVEVVIMTCNLTQLDFAGLTQMLWRSGRLKKGLTASENGRRFSQDLTAYLDRYRKQTITKLAAMLRQYDFSPVTVSLLPLVPGFYSTKGQTYGYGKLHQLLQEHRQKHPRQDQKDQVHVLAQVSSMAAPFALKNGQSSSVFTHLLCPTIFAGSGPIPKLDSGQKASEDHQNKHNYVPQLIFPSSKDVATSNFGFMAGTAIHFKKTGSAMATNNYEQNIKPYLHLWKSGDPENSTGREDVPPHVKIYACDNGDNWKTLDWLVMGSHNLSKQAWGGPNRLQLGSDDPNRFEVASYELSVFVPGDLVPVYGCDSVESDKTPVRMPFKLPPTRYSTQETVWSPHSDFGPNLQDRWGNCHRGGF